MGSKTVQALQDQYEQSLSLVGQSEEAIYKPVLSLAVRVPVIERIDLYNKSHIMGDYQARFCERLRVKLSLPTRRLGR